MWGVARMRYGVRFASDEEMPDGHDALVLQVDGEAVVVYRDSVVSRDAVTTAWTALQAAAGDERPVPADELLPRRIRRAAGVRGPTARWAISSR